MASLADVASTLDQLVADGLLAGWVAGVSDGSASDVRCGGRRAVDADAAAMTPDTLFAQSSCTKPWGGALTLRLVEDGVLGLDDPVAPWLPELAEPRVLRAPEAALDDTVPAARPITVRHLLTMTPGFGWVSEPGPLADAFAAHQLEPGPWAPAMDPDEFLARLGALPLANQPGALWRYHTSSDVLGVLLSRATGASLTDLLAAHLLDPLGLTDTGFTGDPARMATAHAWEDDRLILFPVPEGTYTTQPRFESLAAGLVSTVGDQLALLGQLAGGGDRNAVLTPASRRLMCTDHLRPEQRPTAPGFLEDDAGWGLQVEIRGDGLVGWAGGLGTIGYADPGTGRAAVLATQLTFDAPGTVRAFEAFWRLFDGPPGQRRRPV